MLFLIAQYALDLANNIEVVLIAAGLAAVLVEVLTMVSGGLLAILGALLALAGLTMAFVPNEFEFDPSDGRYLSALADAATSTLVAVGVLAVGLVAAIFLLPRSPMLGRLANRAEVTATSRSRRPSAASRLVGMRGVAAERLSPAGVVIVAGESRTASTEHGVFVEEGTEVVVVRAAFGELVVRPLADGGP
ncbi:MAG: hypothetical protein GWN79_25350, partial [Actinobacteria bacterium]|nr:hypothetical protein [Actinomycetota bacterium]NIT98549.1 hypothetical protein [Actinomycetota bacterium]NIU22176.1 hypothetical protein [Actinomycetota bacterium]NIU70711.1 hypothetical protein [Actinomycetota bacterium]NIV90298.1 hypothetical protein [Actinomycetota bacterium]